MDGSLRIVVVGNDPARVTLLEEGLREAGHTELVRLDDLSHLLSRILGLEPDVVLIDLAHADRALLDDIFQMSRALRRPLAIFVEESDAATIDEAVKSGVSAYIVGGLRKERVESILNLSISRFNAFARLEEELERTRTALDERKVIDRAKGILMKAKNLSEEDAYALLRRTAMNGSKKIAQVAQSVVTATDLLK